MQNHPRTFTVTRALLMVGVVALWIVYAAICVLIFVALAKGSLHSITGSSPATTIGIMGLMLVGAVLLAAITSVFVAAICLIDINNKIQPGQMQSSAAREPVRTDTRKPKRSLERPDPTFRSRIP